MVTLSSIVIAVPLGIALGALLGIAAFRHPRFERAITPFLDLMQTVPVFAYLVPILWFFGFNPVAAMIATIVYAMPPMVRNTVLALQRVPGEVVGLRPYGRLHAPPDDVEGAGSFGTPRPDDRRQPGDHALAQHGDHRLDDRGGRARPRGAGGAAPARLRRRPRGGDRDHAARDRARPALAGVRAPAAAGARRGGAELRAAPSASGRGARPAARRLGARRAVAGGRALSAKPADEHRRCRQCRHGMGQHPPVRHHRGDQGVAPDQPAWCRSSACCWACPGPR